MLVGELSSRSVHDVSQGDGGHFPASSRSVRTTRYAAGTIRCKLEYERHRAQPVSFAACRGVVQTLSVPPRKCVGRDVLITQEQGRQKHACFVLPRDRGLPAHTLSHLGRQPE